MKDLNINLDAITDNEELEEIAFIYQLLHEYTLNKAMAIKWRKLGEINKAIRYEKACDTTYEAIPKEWRQW